MEEKIDTAIMNTLALMRANVKPEDAIKVSQSVLNLAQAKQLLLVSAKK